MKMLQNARIIDLKNSYEDNNYLYLVMHQMIDDLRNIMLMGEKSLEEEIARKVFKMMVEAVDFCH